MNVSGEPVFSDAPMQGLSSEDRVVMIFQGTPAKCPAGWVVRNSRGDRVLASTKTALGSLSMLESVAAPGILCLATVCEGIGGLSLALSEHLGLGGRRHYPPPVSHQTFAEEAGVVSVPHFMLVAQPDGSLVDVLRWELATKEGFLSAFGRPPEFVERWRPKIPSLLALRHGLRISASIGASLDPVVDEALAGGRYLSFKFVADFEDAVLNTLNHINYRHLSAEGE